MSARSNETSHFGKIIILHTAFPRRDNTKIRKEFGEASAEILMTIGVRESNLFKITKFDHLKKG